MRKWCEQRRPGSDHNINIPRLGTFKLIKALSLGKFGIHNGYPVPKPVIKPHHSLIGECNLRDQDNCLPSLCHRMRNQFHINFCFSASGYSPEQIRFMNSSLQIRTYCVHNTLLIFIQCQMISLLIQM